MTPALVAPVRERPKCPVCGKVSYSAAGIHPQCAANREDAGRRLLERAKREAEAAAAQAAGFTTHPAANPSSLPLPGAL